MGGRREGRNVSQPRQRGAVEVVAFEEPSIAGHGRRVGPGPMSKSKRRRRASEGKMVGLAEIRSEVDAFGASGQSKREKKAFEEARLVRLGCKPSKKEKMPLKVLFSREKTLRKRDEKIAADLKASGVVTGKDIDGRGRKRKAEKETEKRLKRRRDDIHNWNNARFKGGVLRVRLEDQGRP